MARYIDADKYKADLLVGQEYLDEDTLLTATNLLDCQPTADVVEVRHGRWIEDSLIDGASFCSLCGYEDYRYDNDRNEWGSKYCPNCGAEMDGKE